jgi:hypothetical protein
MPDPLQLLVGDYYDSGIQRWPGAELVLTTDGGLFLVDMKSPAPAQIEEFSTAAMQFAWLDARHNGVLCYRFGESAWQHHTFNPHCDTPPGTQAGLPKVESGQSFSLLVGLADVDRTPVLAVRKVRWPEHFASTVRMTLARLAGQPYDDAMRVNECNDLHLFVGSERLARRAGVRCRTS